MKKHRVLFFGLALMAVMGVTANQARAELISITVSIAGGPSLVVDALADVGSNSYNVISPTGITALNGFLANNDSAYQFVTLGGSSNYAGNSTQGQLVLNGEAQTGLTLGTKTGLTITESEGGFTAPTGTKGLLTSSSSGNFTNQPAGAGQTVNSMFNATSTPTYFVDSTGPSVNPGTTNGPVSVGLAPVPTLYTLTNNLTLGLSIGTSTTPIDDTFGVSAVVTAASVPEPSTLVTMLTGLPLPIVMVALLRRRRAVA